MRSLTLRYLSISLRMKLHSAKERNGAHSDFQFLWGWNLFFKLIHIKWWCLSIPLRMKRYIQACDGVGETLPLSIPLRMKPEYKRRIRKISYWATFNSFEDETTMPSRHHYCPTNSFNSFEDETYYYEKPGDVGGYFQFLWGWNTISIKLWNSQWLSFNSFEDETGSNDPPIGGRWPGFQFLWGWNIGSIGNDEIYLHGLFQFLWGWNFQNCLHYTWRSSLLSIPLRMKRRVPRVPHP